MVDKTYGQIQREYRDHLKREPSGTADSIRVSLQSNFTIDPFAAYLWDAASAEGINLTIHAGPYDQYTQEFLNPASNMYSLKPDIVFVIFGPGMESHATTLQDTIFPMVESFQNNSNATLTISNLIKPSNPFKLSIPKTSSDVANTNKHLTEIINGKSGIHLLDIEELSSFFGKENITDLKLHYLGKIDFSHDFMKLLAKKCLTYIRLRISAPRKVLILDLDNTLWGGIVGEDGIDGISLSESGAGSEFHDFQKEIKALQQQGILLAICSKNNHEDAMNVINNHPAMILREKDFSSIKINWRNKAENIREMAPELNLGTDSFVFLDDSPVERGIVRASLPEVAVPELPQNAVFYATFIKNMDLFESLSKTDEDANRSEMYAVQKKRDAHKTECVTVDDYIKSLNIRLSISPVTEKSFSRACQLIMKTNQFNMTTRRHSEATMNLFINSPEYELYTLGVKDNFGDSGLTGLVILKYEKEKCIVDTLLLSCRILGRRIEETFVSVIAEIAKKRASILQGEYIQTKKNSQVSDFYLRMGFHNTGIIDNMETYVLDLNTERPLPCDLHTYDMETGD